MKELYRNDTDIGRRINIDKMVMIKTLFLQSMYKCCDEVMEGKLNYKISFRNFLHYPEIIPDSRTIWLFRERLSTTGKDKVIWNVNWKQFEDRGISIKEGMVQEPTFIETNSGKHRKNKPPVSLAPESVEIMKDEAASTETKKSMTREEKSQVKIRNIEKKRLRREEGKYGRTRRSEDGI